MKRCPTCQRVYADDSLKFCLEDGATLLGVSDAPARFDPDATLRDAAPGSRSDAPTEILKPHIQATVPSSKPAPPTTPQQRMTEHISPSAAPPSTRSSNRALVAGIIVICFLLLTIIGIGIALLLRETPGVSHNTNVEISGGNANRNNNSSPGTNSGNSTPAVDTNSENGNSTAMSNAAARIEAKILKDTPLVERELTGLSPTELRRLRNTVYARHGRTFDTRDLQRYFETRPWYKPRSDYSSEDLTTTDHANIKLLQTAENSGV
jgi:YARHG domain